MKIKNLYLLMLIAACMTAMTATASVNKFFIDDLRLTPDDLGTRITIPVKASFETPVSTWDVKFVLPYGLSIINISRGSDMDINYIDSNGREKTYSATYAANKDSAHVIGTTFGYCVYDEDYSVDYQLKWDAGNYDDMLVLTVNVWYDFSGGNIEIISETACGYDAYPTGLIPDTLYSGQNEEEYYKGDVDMDGSITVNDVTVIIDFMLNGAPGSGNQYMATNSDINFDGNVDVCDIVELLDFLIHWDLQYNWYTGYEKNVCTTTTEVTIPIEYPFFNQFFIEDLEISPDDLGQNITIPVMAYFEGYVNSWDVEFEFPEGLTPIAFSPGRDMTVDYCDRRGNQKSERAWCVHNNDLTHFIATIINVNYIPTEDEEYEMSGSVKWEPGSYGEMFLLTVRVDETFQGGTINVHSKTTFGKDLRFDALFYPVTMDYPGEDESYWPGDVNGDGIDDVEDVNNLMHYFVDPVNWPIYAPSSGDIHIDGVIDLRDMEKLIDYLLWGEWYEWYTLSTEESACYFMVTMPVIPGDMDGNHILDIDDITSIIDVVLNGGDSSHADVNNDGIVDIDDVTALISIILNGN